MKASSAETDEAVETPTNVPSDAESTTAVPVAEESAETSTVEPIDTEASSTDQAVEPSTDVIATSTPIPTQMSDATAAGVAKIFLALFSV